MMQCVPVRPDGSTDQLSQINAFTPSQSMDNSREIYSWPSGWKDMRKSPNLPTVRESKNDKATATTSHPIENNYPVLPVISPDGTGEVTQKRKLLKRQSKVYFGIGSVLPPLQEASLKLAKELRELTARSLSVETGPVSDDNVVSKETQTKATEDVKLSETDSEAPNKTREKSYAVFHNGIYFEVHQSNSPSPSLDKHELRINPKSERKAQEDYILKQLTDSQLIVQDNGQSTLFRDSISPAKTKRVTFSPDIGRDGEEKSKKKPQFSQTKRSQSSAKLTLATDNLNGSDIDYSNRASQDTHDNTLRRATSQEGSCKGRVGQTSDNSESMYMTVSRDGKGDYSPSKNGQQDKSGLNSSLRKRSPWKQRFEERLDQINRRISENVQVSKGTRNTSPMTAVTRHSAKVSKQTLRDEVHTESIISGNEKNQPEPVGNENLVLRESNSTACDGLDLRGASVYVSKTGDTTSERSRRDNKHVLFTSNTSSRGQKASSRVAATATCRRDYVFQFSKKDGCLPTGCRIPRGGSLQEWHVEYLGVDKGKPFENVSTARKKSDIQDPVKNLSQTETRQQTLVALDRLKTGDSLGMSSTYTLQRDILPSQGRPAELGKDILSPRQNEDSDMSNIILKVDSSRGYARTELSTLPMIGVKAEDVKDSDNEKNRLYVGSTVQHSSKRKMSRKGESTRRRFSKRKMLSTKVNINKDKHGKAMTSSGDESGDVLPIPDRGIPVLTDVPTLTIDKDTETLGSSSGVGWQSLDTPSSLNSCLRVKHPNTARSSVVDRSDNSFMEVEVEAEENDELGGLIQVSQMNFSEKEKLKRQSRPTILKSERKIQRSPRPRLPKSNTQPPLPPIVSRNDGSRYGESLSRLGENVDRLEEEPKSRQEMRTGRMRPWMKQAPQNFSLPRLQADASMAMTSTLAVQAREDISRVVSEIEKMRWNQEQHEERVLTYGVKNFVSPRVVLVSSRIARCHSMKKAIRKDKNVIFIVYDFDNWSFDDMLSTVRSRLDQYNKDCKMHSVLFLCGGGIGFCYLLKNYVMTPQKLQRSDYAPVLEFWGKIGSMVSKLNPEEATINIMGCSLDADKPGKEVLSVVRKAVHPNVVRVESPSEHMAEGRKTLNQYFVYRRFLLWRTTNDDIVNRLGQGQTDADRERTWSELAEDADSDS